MIDNDDPKTWQLVMMLDCSTTEETEIEGYGDFQFILRKIEVQELGLPVQWTVKQSISNKLDKNNPFFDYWVQTSEYPQYKNAKQAFHNINVEINCSKEEFRENYGFWQLSQFTVYERTGNQSKCSFKAGDYYYYGEYYTS